MNKFTDNQLKNLSSIKVFLDRFLLMKKSAKFLTTNLHITIVIRQAMTTLPVAI